MESGPLTVGVGVREAGVVRTSLSCNPCNWGRGTRPVDELKNVDNGIKGEGEGPPLIDDRE